MIEWRKPLSRAVVRLYYLMDAIGFDAEMSRRVILRQVRARYRRYLDPANERFIAKKAELWGDWLGEDGPTPGNEAAWAAESALNAAMKRPSVEDPCEIAEKLGKGRITPRNLPTLDDIALAYGETLDYPVDSEGLRIALAELAKEIRFWASDAPYRILQQNQLDRVINDVTIRPTKGDNRFQDGKGPRGLLEPRSDDPPPEAEAEN